MKRVLLSAAILPTLAVVSLAQQASEFGSVPWVDQSGSEPAIIQHGWTSPDTIYLRRNIGELEKRPFTGTVTWISWPRQENGRLWIKALPGDPPNTPLYDLGRRILTRDRLPAEAIEGAATVRRGAASDRAMRASFRTWDDLPIRVDAHSIFKRDVGLDPRDGTRCYPNSRRRVDGGPSRTRTWDRPVRSRGLGLDPSGTVGVPGPDCAAP